MDSADHNKGDSPSWIGGIQRMRSESLAAQGVGDEAMMPSQRVKVHIRCRKCGETFILRGVRDAKGHIETGFKRCLCDNEEDFDVEPLN